MAFPAYDDVNHSTKNVNGGGGAEQVELPMKGHRRGAETPSRENKRSSHHGVVPDGEYCDCLASWELRTADPR